MIKLGMSKVMLSTLIAGGAIASINSINVEAPNENKKGEAQIDFPSNVVDIDTLEKSFDLVNKMKLEAVKVEQVRLEEIERLRLAELEKQRKNQLEKELVEKKKIEEEEKKKWTTFEASYYTDHCNGCSGISKSGIDVRGITHYQEMQIIAADLKILPLYSIIEISSNGDIYKAIVLDSGGAIKGNKLDILKHSRKEAYSLGRHNVKVKIIRYGKGE